METCTREYYLFSEKLYEHLTTFSAFMASTERGNSLHALAMNDSNGVVFAS